MKRFDNFKELNEHMKDVFNSQRSTLKKQPSKGEVNTMPSMTVPDQTMSLATIMQRYARGETLTGKTPIWNELDTLPDLRTLDLAELEQIQQQNRDFINETMEQIKRSEASTKPAVIKQMTGTPAPNPDTTAPPEAQRSEQKP